MVAKRKRSFSLIFKYFFEILMACNASRSCWETKRKIIIIELKLNGKMKEIFFEYLMN